jgi:2-hydroxychromene-2-carboxylate isomerase
MALELYFDVVCPFAYLASQRVPALARAAGVPLRWRPILLGGVLRALGGDVDPNASMPAPKRRLTRLDMLRQADLLGVPLAVPADHPRRTLLAMRWLTAVPDEQVPALAERLFRAYWVDGVDLSDRAALRTIGRELGADVDALIDDPAIKAALRARTDEAVARGVFGVPTVFVRERSPLRSGGPERLVWGADRLWQVEEALGLPTSAAPALPAPGSLGPTPRAARPGAPIELFHDFASPFSYLASTQIHRVAAEVGAAVTLTPILVGALFDAIGTPMVPVDTFAPAKQAYVRQDLSRWAARWGVPFRFASRFPIRSLHAGRVALAEPAATDALYRAAWAEDRDISTADGLQRVLDDAGFDGVALLEQAQQPAVKEALRANTERAVAQGVCGVPTAAVGDQLFWGQDRLDHVALASTGWRVAAAPG